MVNSISPLNLLALILFLLNFQTGATLADDSITDRRNRRIADLNKENKKARAPHFDVLTPLEMHPVEEVWSIHLLPKYFSDTENGLLIFRPGKKITGVYKIIDGKLRYLKRMKPWAYIGAATTMEINEERRIAVGYEYRIEEKKKKWQEKDSVLFVVYDRELNESQELLFAKTPFPKVNFLREIDGSLWLNYFHEEDFSKGGFISKKDNKWKFKRFFAGWKQDSIDIHDRLVVVGSPYSDDKERAKELMLFKNDSWLPLPSYRGVKFVTFAQLDEDPRQEIAVADGLPNTRDKRGRPKIGYIDYNESLQKWERHNIGNIGRSQHSFEHIIPLNFNGKPHLLVRGDLYVDLYQKISPEKTRNGKTKEWKRIRLYRRKDRNYEARLQSLILKNDGKSMIIAILDDTDVMLYSYSGKKSRKTGTKGTTRR